MVVLVVLVMAELSVVVVMVATSSRSLPHCPLCAKVPLLNGNKKIRAASSGCVALSVNVEATTSKVSECAKEKWKLFKQQAKNSWLEGAPALANG